MLHSGSRPVTRGALAWSACWQTLTETPCHGLTRHAVDTLCRQNDTYTGILLDCLCGCISSYQCRKDVPFMNTGTQ